MAELLERRPLTAEELKELERRFTYHAPKGDQPVKYQTLRTAAEEVGALILSFCPDNRERALALTKLDELVMWANASIARE